MAGESPLGSAPIGRLLIKMSIPMMISMLIQALYNMVDAVFVASISEDALTAVSLAYPMQNAMVAIAVGTGVAMNSLIPRFMGQGRRHEAERCVNVAVFLFGCYTLLFVVVGVFFARPFYEVQVDHPVIIEYGTDYLAIVCAAGIGVFYGQCFEKLLIATGNSLRSMIAQGSGAIANIILDPILIFGLGPIPAMGVTGAAIATVLGQILGAAVAYVQCVRMELGVGIRLSLIRPRWDMIKQLFSVGLPSTATIGCTSLMSFFMNAILLSFSYTAAAVYGAWIKLQSFAFMPIFGMNMGTTPIIAFNYGKGDLNRVNAVLRLALKVAMVVMTLMLTVFQLMPAQLMTMFEPSDYMLEIGVSALRTMSLSFHFAAVTIILSISFQAMGRPSYALIANSGRNLVVYLPVAWLLSRTGRLEVVWLADVITNAIMCAVVLLYRRRIKRIAEEELRLREYTLD